VVLIPIVLLLVLRAPVPLLAVVAAGVALLTVYEFLELTEKYGVQPFRKPTYFFVALLFALLASNRGNGKPLLSTEILGITLGFAAAIAPFVFLVVAMRRDQMSWCNSASNGLAPSWSSFCCSPSGREISLLIL